MDTAGWAHLVLDKGGEGDLKKLRETMCLVGDGASGVEGPHKRLRLKGASLGGVRRETQTLARYDLLRQRAEGQEGNVLGVYPASAFPFFSRGFCDC